MDTYYVQFDVVPDESSPHLAHVKGALVHCWLKANSAESATLRSTFKTRQVGWKITKMSFSPTVVSEESFKGKEIGLQKFQEAQSSGFSMAFVAATDDKDKLDLGYEELPPIKDIDLAAFHENSREIRAEGRCLHFENGNGCDQIIDAHTIQKSSILKQISTDGMVYVISGDFNDLKRNGGIFQFKKRGINVVSTFRGFCRRHDNELFRPIDDSRLIPTDEQITLYAYRSLCRELFAKECAIKSYENQLAGFSGTSVVRELIESVCEGSRIGFRNLQLQKQLFDEILKSRYYEKIQYTVFFSKDDPNLVFSGGLFPDFGFSSEPIQNLADRRLVLDFIAFFSAPTSDGWAFCFAWLRESSRAARFFLHTLAKAFGTGRRLEDCLFNLVIKGSENIAIAPVWWEQLTKEEQCVVCEAAMFGADLYSLADKSYLSSKLEVLHGWNFTKVQDNADGTS